MGHWRFCGTARSESLDKPATQPIHTWVTTFQEGGSMSQIQCHRFVPMVQQTPEAQRQTAGTRHCDLGSVFSVFLSFVICPSFFFIENHSKSKFNGPPVASSSRTTGVKPGRDLHRSAQPKMTRKSEKLKLIFIH